MHDASRDTCVAACLVIATRRPVTANVTMAGDATGASGDPARRALPGRTGRPDLQPVDRLRQGVRPDDAPGPGGAGI